MQMTEERLETLNTRCLIGLTDLRGYAWHYAAELQGDEPNHYPGSIPVDDIIRRLFDWEAIEVPLQYEFNGELVTAPNRKVVCASDNGDFLNVSSSGYQPHQYKEWLLDNVADLLDDDDLAIGSALLLRNRGVAAVSVEVPENITTQDGVIFRPNLVVATSFDKSLATRHKRTVTKPVCDNTLDWSLQEEGQEFKVAHTRNSQLRLGEAREALQIIFSQRDEFTAQVDKLCAEQVSERQWEKVLDALVPYPEDEDKKRAANKAEKKRSELAHLWSHDERVEPWKGTAYGVLQAFNTWNHHFKTVKKVSRYQRNYDNVISGDIRTADLKVADVLGAILDKENLLVAA
jgi:phage/plasmid-like protein (TIGR03299 family)